MNIYYTLGRVIEFNYQLDFVAMCEIIFFSRPIEFISMQLYNSKI